MTAPTIYAVISPNDLSRDEDGNYRINNEEDWDAFGNWVKNGGNGFSGKTVKLTADISVTTPQGGDTDHAFEGTFDGQGHTLTMNHNTPYEFGTPFSYVKNATIKNLKTAGTIKTSAKFAAGIVGYVMGTTNITNCVSSMTIDSSVDGDGSDGGLVAYVEGGGTLTITGCQFDGKLLGEKTTSCGGFVGWSSSANTTIKNSFYHPKKVTVSSSESATFQRGGTPTVSNSYYTETLGDEQGKQQYCIKAGDAFITSLTNAGTVNETYDVSGLKFYNVGMEADVVLYALSGEKVKLGIENSDIAFGTVNGYTANYGTFSGNELTMRDNNTVVSLDVTPNDLTKDGDDYLINNKNDWDAFTHWVKNGTTFSGERVKLAADIEGIGNMVGGHYGNEDKTFQGTFDGQSHTLNVNITSSEQMAAPFRYIYDATIKDLAVTGSVTGEDYHAAGLVGYANGNSRIEDCLVSTDVNAYILGSGIVGHAKSSNLEMMGCVYNGTITNTADDVTDSNRSVGGLVGWCQSATMSLMNCYFNGTYDAGTSNVKFHPVAIKNSSNSPTVIVTNVYYSVEPDEDNDGEDNVATHDGKLAYTITVTDDTEVSYPGVAFKYSVTDILGYSTGIKYNDVMYAGAEEEVSLVSSKRSIMSNVGDLTYNGLDNGKYTWTLVMPADNVLIQGSSWEQEGTEDDPYLIKNDEDWEILASDVNRGYNYKDKFFRLDADISATQMVGQNEKRFSATFDGDGHTLDVNINSESENTAPFYYINGATIKNLKVTGSITASKYIGGIVAQALGDEADIINYIINCRSSVAITSTYSGDGTNGGILGHASSGSAVIEGCVFDGKLLGANCTHNGGIVGQVLNGATLKLKDCVFAPAEVTFGDSNSATLSRTRSDATLLVTNCYYTQAYGDAQGTATRSIKPGEEDVELSDFALSGNETDYNVAGVTFYGNGGFALSPLTSEPSTLYYGNGNKVDFKVNEEFVDASAGTLVFNDKDEDNDLYNYTITMPDEDVTIYAGPLVLYNDRDIKPTIEKYHEAKRTVRLKGRTFKHDGSWQTLCLPFAVDDLTGTPLEGAKLYILEQGINVWSVSNNDVTLKFKSASNIQAHLPYIFKWDDEGDDVIDPEFSGVTILNSYPWPIVLQDDDVDMPWLMPYEMPEYTPVPGEKFAMAGTYYPKTLSEDAYYYRVKPEDGVVVRDNYTLPSTEVYFYNGKPYSHIIFDGISEELFEVALNKDDREKAEGSKNADLIANHDGKLIEVSLQGTTLKRNRNAVQTLCLPFDLDYFDDSDINGFTVLKPVKGEIGALGKNGEIIDGKKYYIYCDTVTSIEAHQPYIIKWTGKTQDNIENPKFRDEKNGIRMKGGDPQEVKFGDDLSLCGVYTPLKITEDGGDNYFVDGSSSPASVDNSADTYPRVYAMEVYIHTYNTEISDIKILGQVPVTDLWDGKGIQENRYKLYSAADLNAVSAAVSNGVDFQDEYFLVSADIEYTGTDNYTPIGSKDTPFNANFSGNGHTISGIYLSNESDYQGLFGYLGKYGTITDLTLTNGIIEGNNYVGGFAGYIDGDADNTGYINHCHVGEGMTVGGVNYHGGIMGYNCGYVRGCTSLSDGIVGETDGVYGFIEYCLDLGETEYLVKTMTNHSLVKDLAFTIVGSDDVTLDWGTAETDFSTDTEGVKAYGFGLLYKGIAYAKGNENDVKFTPSTTDIYASSGTLTNNGDGTFILQMDNADVVIYKNVYDIELADNADNSDVISGSAGKLCNVTLAGRTLYRDGTWNTLCLPFDVESFEGTPLEGATVKGIDTADAYLNGTLLTLNFWPFDAIQAGKPYIVKWETEEGAEALENIENPVFENVTISTAEADTIKFDYGFFAGTYSPLAATDGLMFDEHNQDNGAFTSYLSVNDYDDEYFTGWYTDEELTTLATTIPFTDDGTVRLFAKVEEPVYDIAIYDSEDNSDVLASYAGKKVNVTYDRILSATDNGDDTWTSKAYTVCLPYDIDLREEVESGQIGVYGLMYIENDKDMIFSNIPSMVMAGTPFVIVVNEDEIELNAENVTLTNEAHSGYEVVNWYDDEEVLGYWRGSFEDIDNEECVDMNAYAMQSDGNFKRIRESTPNAYWGAFRAMYCAEEFTGKNSYKAVYKESIAGQGDSEEFPAGGFDSDADLSETVGIMHIIDENGTHQYFDMQGRKVEGKTPTTGVYIKNGKKVVMK